MVFISLIDDFIMFDWSTKHLSHDTNRCRDITIDIYNYRSFNFLFSLWQTVNWFSIFLSCVLLSHGQLHFDCHPKHSDVGDKMGNLTPRDLCMVHYYRSRIKEICKIIESDSISGVNPLWAGESFVNHFLYIKSYKTISFSFIVQRITNIKSTIKIRPIPLQTTSLDIEFVWKYLDWKGCYLHNQSQFGISRVCLAGIADRMIRLKNNINIED